MLKTLLEKALTKRTVEEWIPMMGISHVDDALGAKHPQIAASCQVGKAGSQ